MDYDVKDMGLAEQGKLSVEWAYKSMPVLSLIKKRFSKQKPLKGIRLGACLHVTTETASLMETLKAGGAEVSLCAFEAVARPVISLSICTSTWLRTC